MAQATHHIIALRQQAAARREPVRRTNIQEAGSQVHQTKTATNLKVLLLTGLPVQDLLLLQDQVQIQDHPTAAIRIQDRAPVHHQEAQHTERRPEAVPAVLIQVEAADHQVAPIQVEAADRLVVPILEDHQDHQEVVQVEAVHQEDRADNKLIVLLL